MYAVGSMHRAWGGVLVRLQTKRGGAVGTVGRLGRMRVHSQVGMGHAARGWQVCGRLGKAKREYSQCGSLCPW